MQRGILPRYKARVVIAGACDELRHRCLGRTLEMQEMERDLHPIARAATSGDAIMGDPEPLNCAIHFEKAAPR
jgi:hypothetical protein